MEPSTSVWTLIRNLMESPVATTPSLYQSLRVPVHSILLRPERMTYWWWVSLTLSKPILFLGLSLIVAILWHSEESWLRPLTLAVTPVTVLLASSTSPPYQLNSMTHGLLKPLLMWMAVLNSLTTFPPHNRWVQSPLRCTTMVPGTCFQMPVQSTLSRSVQSPSWLLTPSRTTQLRVVDSMWRVLWYQTMVQQSLLAMVRPCYRHSLSTLMGLPTHSLWPMGLLKATVLGGHG